MEDEQTVRDNARIRRRYWLAGLALVFFAGIALLWAQRENIALGYIDSELERLGIEGAYEITEFGLTHQRIVNLTIGDPDNPDLTLASADIYLRFGLGYPQIRRVVARGVRLNGRLADGAFHFGQFDQLLPEPDGAPFSLPDIDLELDDAVLRLHTPYGPLALAGAGSGSLENGFDGFFAGASHQLSYGNCVARDFRLAFQLGVDDRRPAVDGSVSANSLVCNERQISAVNPELLLRAIFSEQFDRWGGEARMSVRSLDHAEASAEAIRATVSFDGESGGQTTGRLRLRATAANGFKLGSERVSIMGHYRIRNGGDSFGFDGDVALEDAQASAALLDRLVPILRSGDGTPLGPVGTILAQATQAAGRSFDAQFGLTGAYGPQGGAVRFPEVRGSSDSGAQFILERGEGLQYRWPNRGIRFAGAMRLAGGGFPQSYITLDQDRAGAPIDGYAEIAAIRAGNATLRFDPIRFTAGTDGTTQIVTQIEMTGPLADGRVDRLRIPVAGSLGREGRLVIGQGCVPVRWERLVVAGMVVGPTELPFCPMDGRFLFRYYPGQGISGGGQLSRPRLRGILGGAPLSITAETFRLPLDRPGFTASQVAMRLGLATEPSELNFAELAAVFVAGGIDGTFAGVEGELAGVPIRLGQGGGDWRFTGGILQVDGQAVVTNSDDDVLFEPLDVRDLALRLENSLITMTGGLVVPNQNMRVAEVEVQHDLRDGTGAAVLETTDLNFSEHLQPAHLTNLVLGIVGEVEGLVSGRGTIRWDEAGVTSNGLYQLTDVDLAAPFGPVRGLNAEIRFTDLLGMNTEATQISTIREIDPGVLVEGGVVEYQLLSANRVQVEGARWPFAGGELILEPTILDFRVDQARELTFRVEGVDAFQFLEAQDFENIVATGLFDGKLPMAFDRDGGRIEGGRLVSRSGGGTFSYVGEISDVNLGMFGSLAFNALELIRYSELVIEFGGAIDGEMVTSVSFTGVSPNLAREDQNFLVAGFTRELAKIPLRFDITMNAPFNQMLYSFRLLDDPGFLVNQAIRARINRIQAEQGVQPSESDTLP